MVVVQVWILLTSLESGRLLFLKHILGRDVREQAHESCGAIARWIVQTFFGGFTVASFEKARAALQAGSSSGGGSSGGQQQQPVIIVANHQSMMDVAAIFTLGLRAAWVAKTTVFLIPGVGTLMGLAGYVAVERKSKTSIKKMYAQCKECVRDGWSLILFPQGTRNRQETLPFKDGAYNLAAELGLSVLPVTIHIREDIWLNGSPLKLTIHDPLPTTHDSKQRVKEASFKAIIDCLNREQRLENSSVDGDGVDGNDEDKDNDEDGDDAATVAKGSLNCNNNNNNNNATTKQQNVKQRRGRGTALILKASSVAS